MKLVRVGESFGLCRLRDVTASSREIERVKNCEESGFFSIIGSVDPPGTTYNSFLSTKP